MWRINWQMCFRYWKMSRCINLDLGPSNPSAVPNQMIVIFPDYGALNSRLCYCHSGRELNRSLRSALAAVEIIFEFIMFDVRVGTNCKRFWMSCRGVWPDTGAECCMSKWRNLLAYNIVLFTLSSTLLRWYKCTWIKYEEFSIFQSRRTIMLIVKFISI